MKKAEIKKFVQYVLKEYDIPYTSVCCYTYTNDNILVIELDTKEEDLRLEEFSINRTHMDKIEKLGFRYMALYKDISKDYPIKLVVKLIEW